MIENASSEFVVVLEVHLFGGGGIIVGDGCACNLGNVVLMFAMLFALS